MKILTIADEEIPALWEYYVPGRLKDFDLIISCGDLKPEYLSFIVTMARCPVLYIHGNHDGNYEDRPPEGCDCIDEGLVVYNGIRILGLGGSYKYHAGPHQYTEAQMRRRIRKLGWKLRRLGGVDIIVTHAPPKGLGDGEDPAHWGFECLRDLLDRYRPAYLLHGHVHMTYSRSPNRVLRYNDTQVINTFGRYCLELPDVPVPDNRKNVLIWKARPRQCYESKK